MPQPTPTSDDPVLYAIGDVHGCTFALLGLLAQIEADARTDPERPKTAIFLGDYVDRGPDPRGAVAIVRRWQPGFPVIALRGNHEELMIAYAGAGGGLRPTPEFSGDNFLHNGGFETLASYEDDQAQFAEDVRWMDTLPYWHRAATRDQEYLFVHAGIAPGVPLLEQSPETMVWIRTKFLASPLDHGFVVVHGHTPAPAPKLLPNRIGIDTGAVYGGHLTAVVLGRGGPPRFLMTQEEETPNWVAHD